MNKHLSYWGCVAYIALLIGCTDQSQGLSPAIKMESEIIGRWELSEGQGYYNVTFFDDGTMDVGYSDTFASWDIVNENILKISWSGNNYKDGTQEKYLISFDNGNMIWIDELNSSYSITYSKSK